MLCIPTDEPDPDSQSYERAAPDPLAVAKQAVVEAWSCPVDRSMPKRSVSGFKDWSQGEFLQNAAAPKLLEYAAHLKEVAK